MMAHLKKSVNAWFIAVVHHYIFDAVALNVTIK